MVEDDGMGMELQNDGVLPCQYADQHRSRQPFEPERRMWATALESHLRDTQYVCKGGHLGSSERSRRKQDALDWVADDSERLLTFRWYCSALGLEPGAVRKALSE